MKPEGTPPTPTPAITLIVTWPDGTTERHAGDVPALARRMAELTMRSEPPDMQIEWTEVACADV